MCCHYHGHIIGTITDCKCRLIWVPSPNQSNNISLLFWGDAAGEYNINEVCNFQE
jgi:hypothetical protein